MSDTFRTHDGRTLEQAASDLVQREVLCCMSSMVFALVGGDHACSGEVRVGKPLRDLMEQALDLSAPALDYEGAAREAGWRDDPLKPGRLMRDQPNHLPSIFNYADSAEEACETDGLDAHELEVYEHWAVSTWLTEKLQAAGERVDTDFAGLNVWARTTTGQAISIDAVIERITREMHAAHDDAIDAISRNLAV